MSQHEMNRIEPIRMGFGCVEHPCSAHCDRSRRPSRMGFPIPGSLDGDGSVMDTGHQVKVERGRIYTTSDKSDPQGEQRPQIRPSIRRNSANSDDRRSGDCNRRMTEGAEITKPILLSWLRRVFACCSQESLRGNLPLTTPYYGGI